MTRDFDDIPVSPFEGDETMEVPAKEDFMHVLWSVDGKVQNGHNTEKMEIGLRAYQAAALTRIADGIEKHNKNLEEQNELLMQILMKMQHS